MAYRTTIENQAAELDVAIDPRHVEAWMRSDHGTLNHLPVSEFRKYCEWVAQLGAMDIAMLESTARCLKIR
jgi:CRP-like cAMP-binding protein